ncbi:MAG TPA: hypothetical protein VKX46_09190 [Ktedonobacteraceae bacterium]|nr:hypothetical protein [Ktedonobacteraceae bacterium]
MSNTKQRVSRVERKEYARSTYQRAEAEWKFGTGMHPQNAFVSG